MVNALSFNRLPATRMPMTASVQGAPRFGSDNEAGDMAKMLMGLSAMKGVGLKGHEAAMLVMNTQMGAQDDVYGLNHDGSGLTPGPLVELHRLHPDPVARDRAFISAFFRIVTRHFGKGAQPDLATMMGNGGFKSDVAALVGRSFTQDKPPGPLVQALIGANGEDINKPITGAELNALV